jgi:hypothetical protein
MNYMKKTATFALIFVIINILILNAHWLVFRSNVPYLAFATFAAHIIGLIYFPYTKIFKK